RAGRVAAAQRRGDASGLGTAPVAVSFRLALVAVLLVASRAALAIEEIHLEESVADLLSTPPAAEEETAKGRQWAVLPQVGYGPDTGPLGGLKFTHRNVGGLGLTVDIDGTYALEQQQDFRLIVGTPHLLDDRFLTFSASAITKTRSRSSSTSVTTTSDRIRHRRN